MSSCQFCGSPAEPDQLLCPVCGQPPHLDPAEPDLLTLPPRRRRRRWLVGLVVLLLGLGGLGGLLYLPSYLAEREASRLRRTVSDLRTIAVALEGYALQQDGSQGFYPVADSAAGLARHLVPKHLDLVPTTDAWGAAIRYQCWQEDASSKGCDTFRLVSSGSDGIPEHLEIKGYGERTLAPQQPGGDLALGPAGLAPRPAAAAGAANVTPPPAGAAKPGPVKPTSGKAGGRS